MLIKLLSIRGITLVHLVLYCYEVIWKWMMTRAELIKKLSSEYPHISCLLLEDSVKSVFDYMCSALVKGERIELRGFGSFSLRHRMPRKARNPKTGEELLTEDKFYVHFKPGKELKDRVNVFGQDVSHDEKYG